MTIVREVAVVERDGLEVRPLDVRALTLALHHGAEKSVTLYAEDGHSAVVLQLTNDELLKLAQMSAEMVEAVAL